MLKKNLEIEIRLNRIRYLKDVSQCGNRYTRKEKKKKKEIGRNVREKNEVSLPPMLSAEPAYPLKATPITRPFSRNTGPPLFPEFMAASIYSLNGSKRNRKEGKRVKAVERQAKENRSRDFR